MSRTTAPSLRSAWSLVIFHVPDAAAQQTLLQHFALEPVAGVSTLGAVRDDDYYVIVDCPTVTARRVVRQRIDGLGVEVVSRHVARSSRRVVRRTQTGG